MKRLLNNPVFVLVLAGGALLLLGFTVFREIGDRPDFSPVALPVEPGVAPRTREDSNPVEGEPPYMVTDAIQPMPTSRSVPVPGRARSGVNLAWVDVPARDPFAPAEPESSGGIAAAQEAAPTERPQLDALVAGPDSLLAILNGRILRQGERLGIYELARISPEGVELRAGRTRIWLPAGKYR